MIRTELPRVALPARTALTRRLTLGRLLALVAAGPATVVILAVAVGIAAITHQNAVRADLIGRVEPANVAGLRLLTAMVNQETGIRGFELTGNRQFLQPYQLGVTEAATEERILARAHVTGTAAAFTTALASIHAWESATVAPALRTGPAGLGHHRIDTTLVDKARFDAIRASLGELSTRIGVAVIRVKGALARSAAATEVAFSVIGVALILSLLAAGLLLRRFATRPLADLAGAAREVAEGQLDRSVLTDGPRDLARLAADVEGMRLALVRELAAARETQDQLSVVAADLRRSNSELEQFAYVASHDLQEPLRKVTSFCQLLESRYGNDLDERGLQYIAFAVDGATRMQQLVNDLLAFSRVGRSGRAVEAVPLNELVAAALSDLGDAVEASGATVTVKPLPTLTVEPALLRAVFQNLIANAIKFRAEAAPQVRIEAVRDGEEWQICCSDNGIGIDAEYAERIFIIFQRLHTREAYPGTGIGLAMCRKIVEHHGGRIWLDESYRSGTRMCFTLPVESMMTTSGEPLSE
ncbi:ATP-binding protein [Conexibacter sp. DBS9H8]|uniref:sensor histidine kinase n=1 Tax=Conexibacter sp. DBS9H8 TaxID=2937801 RepID=UPI00200C76DA|nr:sensor histidine kinase [Conexibacter sp. DBS9H8]